MKQFTLHIRQTDAGNEIAGEAMFLKMLKANKPGLYRFEQYSLNKRSDPQNRYLHALFTLCVKGLRDGGYSDISDTEDAKWFYKSLFLKMSKVNEQTGEVYEVIRKTSSLSKDEMGNFIDQIREHQLEWFGNYLPTPEEYKSKSERWDLAGLAA